MVITDYNINICLDYISMTLPDNYTSHVEQNLSDRGLVKDKSGLYCNYTSFSVLVRKEIVSVYFPVQFMVFIQNVLNFTQFFKNLVKSSPPTEILDLPLVFIERK